MAASVLGPQTSTFPQQQDLYASGLYTQYHDHQGSQGSPHQNYGFARNDQITPYGSPQRWAVPQQQQQHHHQQQQQQQQQHHHQQHRRQQHQQHPHHHHQQQQQQQQQQKSSKSPRVRDRTSIYHKRPAESVRHRSSSIRDNAILAYATEQSLSRQQSQPHRASSNSASPQQIRQVMQDTSNSSASVYAAQMAPPPSSAYTSSQFIAQNTPAAYIHSQTYYDPSHAQTNFSTVHSQEGTTAQEIYAANRSEPQLPTVTPTTLNPHDTVYASGRAAPLPPMAQMPLNFPPIPQPLESTQNDVDVSGSRQKPQCWDHGCNGRQFSTFSNLLRHQREKNGQANKAKCPHCGAEFTRSTARNGHLYGGKCKGMPDTSKRSVEESPDSKPPVG